MVDEVEVGWRGGKVDGGDVGRRGGEMGTWEVHCRVEGR